MHVLREELPKIEVTISSKHSPQLAEGLATGKLDVAFMRAEEGHPDLVYQVLITEPLIVVLPSDRRLAPHDVIHAVDFVGETENDRVSDRYVPIVRNVVAPGAQKIAIIL
jgi:LysR family hca operon transcriptional activator